MWSKIMTAIHKDLPTGSFAPMPDTIVEVAVCSQSGMLPAEGMCENDERGSQIITEYFAVGTEPTETCTAHGYYNICVETGKLSVGTCPAIPRLMVRRPPNNTIVPEDAEETEYTVADAAYTVPYEMEAAVCPVHGSWYFENPFDPDDPVTPDYPSEDEPLEEIATRLKSYKASLSR